MIQQRRHARRSVKCCCYATPHMNVNAPLMPQRRAARLLLPQVENAGGVLLEPAADLVAVSAPRHVHMHRGVSRAPGRVRYLPALALALAAVVVVVVTIADDYRTICLCSGAHGQESYWHPQNQEQHDRVSAWAGVHQIQGVVLGPRQLLDPRYARCVALLCNI